jgi:hypothetical protein
LSGGCCTGWPPAAASPKKSWRPDAKCNDNVAQVRFRVDLPTYNIDQRLLAGLLQETFLDSYKDAKYFQANLKCSGMGMLALHGTICFYKTVRRRNARTRFRDKLISCFEKLNLSSADNKSFRNHLEKHSY